LKGEVKGRGFFFASDREKEILNPQVMWWQSKIIIAKQGF